MHGLAAPELPGVSGRNNLGLACPTRERLLLPAVAAGVVLVLVVNCRAGTGACSQSRNYGLDRRQKEGREGRKDEGQGRKWKFTIPSSCTTTLMS